MRLLGPIELAAADGPRTVCGVRRRGVLSALALHANDVVSTERLIDIVWGERVPRTAVNTLASHVSHLRRQFASAAVIQARSNGYVFEAGIEATDAEVAERRIRQALAATDPRDTVSAMQSALALWRGRPLHDVPPSAWAQGQMHRLDHLYLIAWKEQARSLLALGRHAQLVLALGPVASEHPLDEQIHEYLMLALYREGLQGNALMVFERLRSALREELGIDPGRVLRDLHAAILRQDESLLLPDRRVHG